MNVILMLGFYQNINNQWIIFLEGSLQSKDTYKHLLSANNFFKIFLSTTSKVNNIIIIYS